MLRKVKWLKVDSPDRPISEIAAEALAERLELVWYYAPLAAKQAKRDVEYVHQLRVATRRAAACMETFRLLLPPRRCRQMKKNLRRLRQAAGTARDLDVLKQWLAATDNGNGGEKFSDVAQFIVNRRVEAQQPLLDAYRKLKRKKFPKKASKLVRRTRWRDSEPEPSFGSLARSLIHQPVEEFFFAGEADLGDTEALHELRICGKRLRYAMELLADAFDSSFRKELYPTFTDVQERLGAINDHATARLLISQWMDQFPNGYQNGLRELRGMREQDMLTCCQQFRDWWTPNRSNDLRIKFNQAVNQR